LIFPAVVAVGVFGFAEVAAGVFLGWECGTKRVHSLFKGE